MAFATLTTARLFHGFNCRSEHSVFHLGIRSNPYTIGAFFLGLILLNLVLFVPFLKGPFQTADITGIQYGLIYILAVIPTVFIQFIKAVKERR